MHKHRNQGVTLIELIVVVVIVALLAAIGYPSYRSYAIRSNRTEAKVELQRITQALEKCFTQVHDYQACVDDGTVEVEVTTPGQHYVTSLVPDTISADTYTLQATPQGGQRDDERCGTLTINQRGDQGIRSGTAPPRECWQR